MSRVLSINTSKGGIPKLPVRSIEITERGLVGDEHDHEKHYRIEQAVCLLDREQIDELCADGFRLEPGSTGENLTLEGVEVRRAEIGDRLEIDGGVVLEISKRRKPCYVLDAIDPTLKEKAVDRIGVYARVIMPGTVDTGAGVRLVRTVVTDAR